MEAVAHSSVADFSDAVSSFLAADPASYSVHLSTVDLGMRSDVPLTLVSLHDNGSVVGVVTRLLPSRPLQVAGMPAVAAPVVASLLRSVDPSVPGLVGPRDRVEAFRSAWAPGGAETVATLFYRLASLVVPSVSGSSVVVSSSSLESWWLEFLAATTEMSPAEALEYARFSMTMPTVNVVWEVDGAPVAWAAATLPVGGASRIGPVYTPPAHRGSGYAAAATAAVCQLLLSDGAREVVLMTNASEPTPNALYRRLGFSCIGDWSYWTF